VTRAKLTNVDIAIYALYRLGGAERPIHTEKVAHECHELAPDRFSWELYPQYPAREPGRSALFDARKPKYGALVSGSKVEGWRLTPAGIDRIRVLQPELEKLAAGDVEDVSDRQKVQAYFRELETHPAFQRYLSEKSCEGIKPYEFTDFLRCTLDSGPEIIKDRIETTRTRAHEAGRSAVLDFLAACEERFAGFVKTER
jgi:hypothetical protein